jgi:hypothetical protein
MAQRLPYSYTTNGTDGPFVTTGDAMNTGYTPFEQGLVYIGKAPAVTGRQHLIPDLPAVQVKRSSRCRWPLTTTEPTSVLVTRHVSPRHQLSLHRR